MPSTRFRKLHLFHVYRVVTWDNGKVTDVIEVARPSRSRGARDIRKFAKHTARYGSRQTIEYCGLTAARKGKWGTMDYKSPGYGDCKVFAERAGSGSWRKPKRR